MECEPWEQQASPSLLGLLWVQFIFILCVGLAPSPQHLMLCCENNAFEKRNGRFSVFQFKCLPKIHEVSSSAHALSFTTGPLITSESIPSRIFDLLQEQVQGPFQDAVHLA